VALLPAAIAPDGAVHVPPVESVTAAVSGCVDDQPPPTNATNNVLAGGENDAVVIGVLP
jgi:hypothetical protein